MNLIKSKTVLILKFEKRKVLSKKLSKYIAGFDFIDKTLIVLSATSGGISIISFTSVIGVIASASFSLLFYLTTGIIKKSKITRNKKKKHNKIVTLAKSKLNSLETLTSQGLIDIEISHEEFKKMVNEKKN